ncbi:MAG TPA: hypothetical protein VF291_12750, partial [Burkholderiaceae bacterium]
MGFSARLPLRHRRASRQPGPRDRERRAEAACRDAIGAALVDHFLARWEEDDVLKALLVPAIAALWADPVEAPGRAGLVWSQFLG